MAFLKRTKMLLATYMPTISHVFKRYTALQFICTTADGVAVFDTAYFDHDYLMNNLEKTCGQISSLKQTRMSYEKAAPFNSRKLKSLDSLNKRDVYATINMNRPTCSSLRMA